jgi:hypothetical protein
MSTREATTITLYCVASCTGVSARTSSSKQVQHQIVDLQIFVNLHGRGGTGRFCATTLRESMLAATAKSNITEIVRLSFSNFNRSYSVCNCQIRNMLFASR